MTEQCFFCGSEDIRLPSVGIAIGDEVEDIIGELTEGGKI